MSNKIYRVLFILLCGVILVDSINAAWEIVSGPRYYDANLESGQGFQLILAMNAGIHGLAMASLLAASIYVARQGGLSSPILKGPGRWWAALIITVAPVASFILKIMWLGSALPSNIAFVQPLLGFLSLMLLFLMLWHTKLGVFSKTKRSKKTRNELHQK